MATREDTPAAEGALPLPRRKRKPVTLGQGVRVRLSAGERATLTRVLTRRFGSLGPAALDRIARASSEQLDRWADSVLDARSLEELLDS